MKRKLSVRIKVRLFRMLESCCQAISYQLHLDYYKECRRQTMAEVKNKKKLTTEQKQEVLAYYKNLTGKKVSLVDHEYFYSRTGVFSKQYMPVNFYETEIIGRANRVDCYNSYRDKNLDEILLPKAKHPHTILRNINGYYYFEGRPVSKQEAVGFCQNIENVIIKPSMADKGEKVRLLSVHQGVSTLDSLPIEKVFDIYERDFLIQDCVRQHAAMSMLNPTSVNTLRILTFRSGMDILLVYAVVRIGRDKQVVDNQSAGGISVKIGADGKLDQYAFGSVGDDQLTHTDSGVLLQGYQIPSYDRAVALVKQLHYSLPLFDLVGWDISIDEFGDPVLIEWNGMTDLSQTACGTGFGELTERIITEIMPRENSRRFDRIII